MVSFKNVCLTKDGKRKVILKNLNLDNLKKIMQQNQYNTVILDYSTGRFLFYDCINNISNKYQLYDLDILSKSDEPFEKIFLFKCDENDIENKITIAENYRTNSLLSVFNNENEQENHHQQRVLIQEKDASNFPDTTIDKQQQHITNQLNYEKTILQCDDDDLDRPTFDDIVTVQHVVILSTEELEDDEDDENCVNQNEPTSADNNDNIIDQSDNNNDINIRNNNPSENIDIHSVSSTERYIISAIKDLSNKLTSLETNVNNRFNIMEKRLNMMEQNLNKRLSVIENNVNLIYERQSSNPLLTLLNSVYLITSDRLETRTFYSHESDLTLRFFHFVSKQLIKNYTDRWLPYVNMIRKLSLKPKSIEINLLGFGRLEKSMYKYKKIYSIQSPTLVCDDNTTNYRLSYVSQCRKNFDEAFTHVLVFEGTTSPVYFETEFLKELNVTSSTSSYKKIVSMKNLLRKLLQLERIIFFLSFYYKIELSQFFAGLICFHFYHNSQIDTNLLLKTVMSSTFVSAIPLLDRLYSMDQFILTY